MWDIKALSYILIDFPRRDSHWGSTFNCGPGIVLGSHDKSPKKEVIRLARALRHEDNLSLKGLNPNFLFITCYYAHVLGTADRRGGSLLDL